MIEIWLTLGLKVLLPFSITTHGVLLAAAGDADAARARYHDSLGLATETGMHFYDAETMRRLAHLAPNGETVSELRTALDLSRSQGARPFELRIGLDLHERLGGDARAMTKR